MLLYLIDDVRSNKNQVYKVLYPIRLNGSGLRRAEMESNAFLQRGPDADQLNFPGEEFPPPDRLV